MKITIPTTLSEITVEQFMKYNAVLSIDGITDEAKIIGAVAVFCNITTDIVIQMPANEVKDIADSILSVLQQEPNFIQRFDKYGFEPNLDEITTAVYMDAEKYFNDITNANRLMAVLYRPITKSILGNYTIEKYEGSDKLCNEMLNAPLEAYLGCLLFFWNLSRDLLKATREYLERPSKEVEQLEQTLANAGVGIQVLTQLLKDYEYPLMKLQS